MEAARRILLIDDEPDFLNNLSLTLEMAGYQALTAMDGSEALTILQTQAVDLIISDINMLPIGGYQLCDLVRSNPQWSKIPFLFLTGSRFVSDAEIQYGKARGINEYLFKPIRSKDLLSAVKQAL